MDTKKCNSCDLVKTFDMFSWKNKSKNIKNSKCKTCHKEYVKMHYAINKETYKSKSSRTNKIYKARNREMSDSVKKIPCMDCGNSYDPICMDFDHTRDKDVNVAVLTAGSFSLKRIREEIEKCEIVCSNCHRLRTKNRRNGVVC